MQHHLYFVAYANELPDVVSTINQDITNSTKEILDNIANVEYEENPEIFEGIKNIQTLYSMDPKDALSPFENHYIEMGRTRPGSLKLSDGTDFKTAVGDDEWEKIDWENSRVGLQDSRTGSGVSLTYNLVDKEGNQVGDKESYSVRDVNDSNSAFVDDLAEGLLNSKNPAQVKAGLTLIQTGQFPESEGARQNFKEAPENTPVKVGKPITVANKQFQPKVEKLGNGEYDIILSDLSGSDDLNYKDVLSAYYPSFGDITTTVKSYEDYRALVTGLSMVHSNEYTDEAKTEVAKDLYYRVTGANP